MSLFFHLLSASNISVKRRPQSEHESRTSPLKRQVRLDVWAEDEMDAVYNIEALYNCIKEYLQQSTEEIKYTLHPRPAGYGSFSKTMIICLLCPLLCGLFFFWKGAKGELSYKLKKEKKHLHNHMKMSLLFYFLNIKFINLKSVHVTPAVNLLLHSDLHVLLHKQFLLLPLSLLQLLYNMESLL